MMSSSEVGVRSIDYGDDLVGKELGILLRERERERERGGGSGGYDVFRSPSAPPTVDGSLSAVGGLYGGDGGGSGGVGREVSEDELRSDPAYINYYYSNVNLNPRLPPPLLSKEDWRYAQRWAGGNGPGVGPGNGPGLGGIGDRRKMNSSSNINNNNNNMNMNNNSNNRGEEFSGNNGNNGNIEGNNNGGNSLFSKGFNGQMEDENGQSEWSGVGLPGLGLGLGSRQKSIAEIIQDDLNNSTNGARIPSRPASRNAFDENIATSEAHLAPLSSTDALRVGGNMQGLSANHNADASASISYASALGGSLSRSTTPDPQLIARAPSPRIPTAGEGRVNSMDKRSINNPSPIHGTSNGSSTTAGLVAALSGMSLSSDPQMDEERQMRSQFQRGMGDHRNLFNLHGDHSHVKQNQHLNAGEFASFQHQSVSHSAKGSYPTKGKSSGVGMDQNYYLRSDGLAEHHKHGGPNSPSNFHSVGSPSSAIPNYSLSGHNINPALASMMAGQLGSGALPPLFENAAASAIGVGGLDSRAMGGNSRANLMAAAAELQNINRGGNQSQLDPLYLHYLTSNDYTAAQLAALNDPSIDGGNSYMDLLALQKAYLGTLLSPQKSECGRPYLGKSAGLNHGYYGNPAFGIGTAYAGNHLANSLLPNSPVGPGSPLRHGERSMRLPSGMRNLAAGMMGNWRSETSSFMDHSFGSSLLDEFKSNKTKCFELSEIAGHVVEFSADQYGSRFIQQKLETASTEEKNMVFHEIIPQALSLMTDVFGNYVIQKFFEHGTASQIRELADKLTGHVLTLSLQMYGCRVIQKAIEVVDLDQQKKMVVELDGHVMRCVRDQNGNHVIQKCIECIPEDAIQFIISTFYDQVVTLSTHPYGCRVIQRVLEHCHDTTTQRIVMDEIMQSVSMLAQDQYGNYVVQHVLEHGKPHERSAIICKLTGKIVQMSQQKFASNVIEKCLAFGDVTERRTMVNEMLGSSDDNEPLQVMMKDQFANYVVQKVLETCDDQQLEVILSRIKNHLNALKKYTYGKHIVARVEKLVAAGERRISLQTPYPAPMVA